MNIKGKIVTLRAPEPSDAALLNAWANDPEIWHGLGGWHFPYSLETTADWIRERDDNDSRRQVFCIQVPEEGLIGTANLVDIDWKNRNAFHGMMLGPVNTRGKGYAQDAVFAIMRYAFDELGLERLDGSMVAYNERSLQFYTRKCGWQIEGTQRSWYYRGGKRHDKIMVGITRDDYHRVAGAYWTA